MCEQTEQRRDQRPRVAVDGGLAADVGTIKDPTGQAVAGDPLVTAQLRQLLVEKLRVGVAPPVAAVAVTDHPEAGPFVQRADLRLVVGVVEQVKSSMIIEMFEARGFRLCATYRDPLIISAGEIAVLKRAK
jgi:hypothetical protein